jgi:YD repeat-containing protein
VRFSIFERTDTCRLHRLTHIGGFRYTDYLWGANGNLANDGTTVYAYDALYRLTAADYSTGDFYRYTYDAVGNRLTQESMVKGLEPALSGGEVSNVSYQYDIANRLADVNGVAYTYDDNGNLLNDEVNEYVYDSANRLMAIVNPQSSIGNSLLPWRCAGIGPPDDRPGGSDHIRRVLCHASPD